MLSMKEVFTAQNFAQKLENNVIKLHPESAANQQRKLV